MNSYTKLQIVMKKSSMRCNITQRPGNSGGENKLTELFITRERDTDYVGEANCSLNPLHLHSKQEFKCRKEY